MIVLYPGKAREETNEDRIEREKTKSPVLRSHVDLAIWIWSGPGIKNKNEREGEKREGEEREREERRKVWGGGKLLHFVVIYRTIFYIEVNASYAS